MCHVIQGTHNEALAPAIRRCIDESLFANGALALRLLADLERGRRISGRLSPGQYDVPFANFRGEVIARPLAACVPRTGSAAGVLS